MLVAWGCAPRTGGDSTVDPVETEDQYAVDFTWAPESNCVVCHKTEGDLLLQTEAAAHINEQGNLCVDCHDPAEISGLHAGKTSESKTPIRLMKTEVPEEACLASGCHIKSDLVAKTASTTALTDREGTVVNPHDLPDNEFHQNPLNVTCVNCHTMHKETVIQEDAYNFCTGGCHHDQVFKCGEYCHQQRM